MTQRKPTWFQNEIEREEREWNARAEAYRKKQEAEELKCLEKKGKKKEKKDEEK